jgi:ligand-binding SRPBCC domain-containing protein
LVRLEFSTLIDAPLERCFDLARSIDFHLQSSASTGEVVIAGRKSGLIGLNETVTWRGRHFGIEFEHESVIEQLARPHHFRDVMMRGSFKSFQHDHFFTFDGSRTCMQDVVQFAAPYAIFGLVAEALLRPYLIRFMRHRTAAIKHAAESDEWPRYL